MSQKSQAQIERLSTPIPIAGCWIWTGALVKSGYGQLTHNGKHKAAHRASFEAFVRPLSTGEWVLHRCDVRACVNPHHLYAGSPIDNRRDTLNRSNWKHPYSENTACKKGHLYVDGSYRLGEGNVRTCRICDRERKAIQRMEAK